MVGASPPRSNGKHGLFLSVAVHTKVPRNVNVGKNSWKFVGFWGG